MKVEWTVIALADIERLHDFLFALNPPAATRFRSSLLAIPGRLKTYPRQGPALPEYENREVRRLLIGQYEMRYELTGSTIFILRIWHTREDR